MEVGIIDRVDIIFKRIDNESSKRIFIHFKKWNSEENEISKKILDDILDDKIVKIVYDFPWYWKCSNSRIPKPTF